MFRLHQRHAGKSKFRQTGEYKKKIKSPDRLNKEAWRLHKGFARDQRKGAVWCKCGPILKEMDHRYRRAYEREMIGTGQWDQIQHHKEMFISSWDAC